MLDRDPAAVLDAIVGRADARQAVPAILRLLISDRHRDYGRRIAVDALNRIDPGWRSSAEIAAFVSELREALSTGRAEQQVGAIRAMLEAGVWDEFADELLSTIEHADFAVQMAIVHAVDVRHDVRGLEALTDRVLRFGCGNSLAALVAMPPEAAAPALERIAREQPYSELRLKAIEHLFALGNAAAFDLLLGEPERVRRPVSTYDGADKELDHLQRVSQTEEEVARRVGALGDPRGLNLLLDLYQRRLADGNPGWHVILEAIWQLDPSRAARRLVDLWAAGEETYGPSAASLAEPMLREWLKATPDAFELEDLERLADISDMLSGGPRARVERVDFGAVRALARTALAQRQSDRRGAS